MKIRFFTAALLLCLSTLCLAAPEFPRLTGRVVDRAGILSASTERQITQQLVIHEQSTTNQIVVATLPNLQGYSIEEFGYQLGRHWQVGQAESNNGVVLLVAKKERKIRIEVGYGLEGSLTDALAANIIQTVIRPQFKKGDFDRGVTQGVEAIIAAIKGEYQAKKTKDSKDSKIWLFLIAFLFLWHFIKPFFRSFGGSGFGGRSGYYRGGGGGFSSGGGGFSGGGGGFGGGGASGGW